MILENSDFVILTIAFSCSTSYSSPSHHQSVYCKFFGVSVAHLSWFITTNGMFLDGRFSTDNQYGKENYILRKHR